MGIVKEPVDHDEDAGHSSSSPEDELLDRGTEAEEDLGPMPMRQYLELQFRLLTKRCPRNSGQGALIGIGLMVLAAVIVAATAALRQPTAPALSLSSGSAGHRPLTSLPTPTHQDPYTCDYSKMEYCSARSLFLSPEIHRVVTDNLIRTSNRFLVQGDYAKVNEYAWRGFREINAELAAKAPVVASELERIQLRVDEKNAVLDVLALVADPTVQSLGFDVAKLIRSAPFPTRTYLKFHVEDSLEPIEEVQKMARELIPESMLKLWGSGGHDWEMTLDPRNIKSMRTDHVKLPASTSVQSKTKLAAIYAGVLQEGRVMVDIMKVVIRAMGPSWSTDLRDATETLFGEIEAPSDPDDLNFLESFLWPLRCAAQGIDALRASISEAYGREDRHNNAAQDLKEFQNSPEGGPRGQRLAGKDEGLDTLRAEFAR